MIRRLTKEDVAVLSLLSEKTFRETFEKENTPEDMENYVAKAFNREEILKELSNKDSFFFLYSEDGEALGYSKLNLAPAQTESGFENSLELQRIYVLSKAKGKGIGTALLNHALDFAKVMGVDYAWLGVWEHNQKAIKFYKKMGFEKFSEHIFLLGQDEQTDYLYRIDV